MYTTKSSKILPPFHLTHSPYLSMLNRHPNGISFSLHKTGSTLRPSIAGHARARRRQLAVHAINPAMSKSCSFEVFGRVQGVFFRKFTQEQASCLGLVGWVQNTSKGTVVGEVQGPANKVEEMKVWLRETGSPASRIDDAQFSEEQDIDVLTYASFDVRR